jgi:hypothetical protein
MYAYSDLGLFAAFDRTTWLLFRLARLLRVATVKEGKASEGRNGKKIKEERKEGKQLMQKIKEGTKAATNDITSGRKEGTMEGRKVAHLKSVCRYIYIYIYVCVCVCVCVYIYIYKYIYIYINIVIYLCIFKNQAMEKVKRWVLDYL